MSDTVNFHDGFSPASRRAYRSDWRIFAAWCRSQSCVPLPASSDTVALFVEAEAERRKPSTVARRLAAIACAHRDGGHADPTKSREVSVCMKKMYRRKGRRQKQALPINFDLRQQMIEAAAPSLISLRNKAMLAVAYDIGCRRSELVSIRVEDIEREEDGSGTVLLRKSKTDQEGFGQVRYLAPDTIEMIDSWLDAAGIEEGFLFRSLRGSVGIKPLPDREVSRTFKKMARAARSCQADGLSGHSTRVGMAQDMASSGIDLASIMQAGGWKTPAMVARYIERLAARNGAAAKLATMQSRGPAKRKA